MERMGLPIGTESFEEIRRNHLYYVDKTSLITNLIRYQCKVTLFARPHGFGKSVILSMLKSFLEIGADQTLFDGLAVSRERELCEQHMGRYPVISFTLQDIVGANFETAYDRFRGRIEELFRKFRFLLDSDRLMEGRRLEFERILSGNSRPSDIQHSLYFLSGLLHEYYGQPVVILIDESDAPLIHAAQHGYYDDMANLIQWTLGMTLKGNDSLKFGVLTESLRLSEQSMCVGLNHVNVESIMCYFCTDAFGFTEEEVRAMLGYYGFESRLEEAREWYGGYRLWHADLYCPWDVLRYCRDLIGDPNARPKSYRIGADSNRIVRQLLDLATEFPYEQKDIESLIAGKTIARRIRIDLIHKEMYADLSHIWTPLYATGYLTPVGEDPNGRLRLAIPNRSVRDDYVRQVKEWFQQTIPACPHVQEFCQAILNGQEKKAEDALYAILSSITILLLDADAKDEQREDCYRDLLIVLLRIGGGLSVGSCAAFGEDLPAILLLPDNSKVGYVIAVRCAANWSECGKSCEDALRQIKEKGYDQLLRKAGRTRNAAYGIAFHGNVCRIAFGELGHRTA